MIPTEEPQVGDGHGEGAGDGANRTRERLLDAAVAVLVERGLAGFTTPAVASLAGTAQGTVFRYFPTKRDLLVGAAATALESVRRHHATAFTLRIDLEQPAGIDGLIRVALETLWASCTDPRSLAVAEIRASCRTDHELRDALDAVIGSENAVGGELVTLLLPDAFTMTADDYVDTSRIVLNAMQGRALAALARPDAERDQAVLESLITLVQDRFARAPAVQPVTRPGEGTVPS